MARCLLLYTKGSPQGPAWSTIRGVPGLNRGVPRGLQADRQRLWPMDGQGRCSDALDGRVTAQAPSCHPCRWHATVDCSAMMMSSNADASPVPKAGPDTPCQAQLTLVPGLRLARRGAPMVLPGVGRGRFSASLPPTVPSPSFRKEGQDRLELVVVLSSLSAPGWRIEACLVAFVSPIGTYNIADT